MKSISRRSLLACALAGAFVAPAALADNWVKLGERSVRLISDYDVIPVTILRGDFRRIKLKVRENGVFINEVAVVYGNGVVDRIPVRSYIPAGGETRNIDLRGGDRIIRSVQLLYRSVPNGKGRAEVRVYGRR